MKPIFTVFLLIIYLPTLIAQKNNWIGTIGAASNLSTKAAGISLERENNKVSQFKRPEKSEKEFFLQKKILFRSEKTPRRGFSERKQKFFCKKILFSLFSGFKNCDTLLF